MDVAVDLYVAVPLLFTVLAVILASVFVRLRSSEEDKATEPAAKEEGKAKASAAAGDRTDGEAVLKDEKEPEAAGAEPRKEKGEGEEAVISREAGRDAVEEIGAAEEGTNEEKEEELREKGKGEVVADEAAPEAVKAEQRSHVQVERKVPGQAERDAVVAAPVALEEQEEDEDEEEEDEDDEEEEESKVRMPRHEQGRCCLRPRSVGNLRPSVPRHARREERTSTLELSQANSASQPTVMKSQLGGGNWRRCSNYFFPSTVLYKTSPFLINCL